MISACFFSKMVKNAACLLKIKWDERDLAIKWSSTADARLLEYSVVHFWFHYFRTKMMESARIRPEYLMGSAEYDTEFYSGHVADVKWHSETKQLSDAIVLDVDTSDEFFIDDIVTFDDNQEVQVEKMPSPIHR